jgi:hypothetical protein
MALRSGQADELSVSKVFREHLAAAESIGLDLFAARGIYPLAPLRELLAPVMKTAA